MADDTNGAAKPAEPPKAAEAPRVQVLAQYIRDLSFENLAMQKDIRTDQTPEIQVQIGLDAAKKGDDLFEVINKLTVESTAGGNKLFILELEYAGRFRLTNVPESQLHAFLMVECPRLIFPYLRRVVGDLTRDGGYPPLNLDNVDYVALFRRELERRAALAQKEGLAVS
jgi:preprotein translocase subunit SecB